MPIYRSPQYVCDFCKRPFEPDEQPDKARIAMWTVSADPRNRRNISSEEAPVSPIVRNHNPGHRKAPDGAERWAPDLNVPSPRFPVPAAARTYDLALHDACATWFLINRTDRPGELDQTG